MVSKNEQSSTNATGTLTTRDLDFPMEFNVIKEIFGLTSEDFNHLRRLSRFTKTVDNLVDTYLRSIEVACSSKTSTSSLGGFFADAKRVEKAKSIQIENFQRLLAGNYDEAKMQSGIDSSLAQHRINLPPLLLIAGYSQVIEAIVDDLKEEGDLKTALYTLLALIKLALMDMSIAVESGYVLMRRASSSEPIHGQGINQSNPEISNLLQALTYITSHVSQIANDLSVSTAEVSAAVNETTTTAEEVTQISDQTSLKAKEVSADAIKVVEASRQGQNATEATVDGMERIREQMEAISQCMTQLSQHSKLISDIIGTVDTLAQQSSLLAVNARLEASRAGQQGKGFQVVAQELKNLSRQSKTATNNVRVILSDVAQATNDATIASDQGARVVEAGHKQAIEAGDVIRTLSRSIDRAADAMQLIEVASQEQLVGMKQMVEAMTYMKEYSERNFGFAEQLLRSSQDLKGIEERLAALTD